jgi:hypothetical protein
MLPQIYKHYSENDKISLLIRHADRDKIPTGEFGNDVLLNEKGKERALNFGKSFVRIENKQDFHKSCSTLCSNGGIYCKRLWKTA